MIPTWLIANVKPRDPVLLESYIWLTYPRYMSQLRGGRANQNKSSSIGKYNTLCISWSISSLKTQT